MVAGDERICTDIMRIAGKSIFAKTGAEGGYALTLFDKGWGAALKIDDGNQRALGPAVIELLSSWGFFQIPRSRSSTTITIRQSSTIEKSGRGVAAVISACIVS